MQLKINKDVLLRHRFWIMVGVAMFLTFTGILWLQFTDAEDKREVLTKAYKEGKTVNPLHNEATAKKLADYAKMTTDQETRIWQAAYDSQKAEFMWHKQVEDAFDFYQGFFALQITVLDPKNKASAKVEEWQKETVANVTHGQLMSVNEDESYITVKGRDGHVRKFYRTPSPNFITIGAPDPKGSPAFKALEDHVGRLVAVTYQRGRYFGDQLTPQEHKAFLDSYASQVREILKIVDPYTERGTGLVQLKDWPYREDALPEKERPFLRWVPFGDVGKQLSKEIWIAQENIWIQREIYKMIAEANDSISKFTDKGIDGQTKMRTFVNPYFEVRLALDPAKNNSLTFIIKNLTDRRQKLDLTFRVKLRGPNEQAEAVYVSGNPLMPAGSKPVKQGETTVSDTLRVDFPMTAEAPRKGIFGLTQELSYQNAAVKRIDYISIGSNDGGASGYSHSHRTFPDGLKSLEDAKSGVPAKPGDPGVPPVPGGGIGKPFGGAGGNKNPLDYELWTERYLDPPDQTRRVPICVALIIDQDHVDRVMTKFNNSKLRLLVTQALLNQYTGSVAPPPPISDQKDPPKFNPFGPIRPGPGFPFQPQGPAAGAAAGDGDSSMELVIYGVMTLYQRYPPRPAPTK